LRFKGADVGHSPRCPKGRVHEESVGNGISTHMIFAIIQCDPPCTGDWQGMAKPGRFGRAWEKFQELFLVPREPPANS
jgi:hypothetical protein